MNKIYCRLNLFISLSFLLVLLACSTDELSRSNAENLIKAESQFPRDAIRPFPVTDCSGTVRLQTKKYKQLESKGLIQYSYEGKLFSCGYAQFTDAGRKFTTSEKYRGKGLDDDTEYTDVKTSTLEFGEIKGIIYFKELNTANVEFTIIVKDVTSFGSIFYDSETGVQGMNAVFIKYDDGWRLKEITPGEWMPDPKSVDNAENYESENSVSDEDYSNMIACRNSKLNLTITGDNVRIRAEPDITKENVLSLLKKGTEVRYIEDKTISGQIWYKVCHANKIGWVSGQFGSLSDQIISSDIANRYAGVWSTNDDLNVEIAMIDNKFRIRVCHGPDATSGGEFWGIYKDNKIVALGNASDFYKYELPTFEKLQNGIIKYNCGTGPYELLKSNFVMPAITYSPPENND